MFKMKKKLQHFDNDWIDSTSDYVKACETGKQNYQKLPNMFVVRQFLSNFQFSTQGIFKNPPSAWCQKPFFSKPWIIK